MTVTAKEAQRFIESLAAAQAISKITCHDLELLYKIGFTDGRLSVFAEFEKAMRN